jgi:transposase-like protein
VEIQESGVRPEFEWTVGLAAAVNGAHTMNESTSISLFSSFEELIRANVRDFFEAVMEDELSVQLERARYERGGQGYRNGHRERTLLTTFGSVTLDVPRARIKTPEGEREFHPALLPKGKRLSKNAESLILACYLCGSSMRRVRIALGQVLGPNVSKSTVSRCLSSLKPEWEAWQGRALSSEQMPRLMLDGFSVPVRLGGQALRISVLVAMGIRSDGQKVVLSLKGMGGERKEAWRELLEDLAARGLKAPLLCTIDGSKGLRSALAEVWPDSLVQRCTVHKERNLLGYAPEELHEELKADYSKVVYAPHAEDVIEQRKEFLLKWHSRCPQVAKSLEEAGEELFTFIKFPPIQWPTLRTTNPIERLNEEFRRRVKVQGVQPSAQSVCMLFWALLASGAISLKRVNGWETLAQPPKEVQLAA